MLKVISFGEALVDMLSNRISEDTVFEHESFTKFPGGAPANVAVAVARLGGESFFVGKLGADMFGDFMKEALDQAGVRTDYLIRTAAAKTALAFVSLDASGERSFEFYRDFTADMLFRPDEFQREWFEHPGIFHICSNTLTEPDIREATQAGILMAREADWLVSFDINLRLNLWSEGKDPAVPIWACIEQADLIKLNAEELMYLSQDSREDKILHRILSAGVSLVVVTDGSKALRYFGRDCEGSLLPPEVNTVDSTAAGDAFMGGLIATLARQDIRPAKLRDLMIDRTALEHSLEFAACCGAHAVMRKGAFTSLPTQADIDGFFDATLLRNYR